MATGESVAGANEVESPNVHKFVAERKNFVLEVAHYPNGDPTYRNRVHVKPIGMSSVFWMIFAVSVWPEGMRVMAANHQNVNELLDAVKFISDYEGEVIAAGKEIWK